ncbi:transposase [Lachnospiraceae bacterium MD1]|uniref:Transposase n=1 Tax=Variimorphobacter saccharofermentans TaxID=2755051 RepID=A0A839K1M5_9FIRM|nr:transposase [Variimorphobacter saccharofermentans]
MVYRLLNQEQYLRTFLEDPTVPLDNNSAEIAIRSFC